MKPTFLSEEDKITELREQSLYYRKKSRGKLGYAYVVFRQNILSAVGLVLVVTMLILAILGPYITPFDPNATNSAIKMQPPSFSHLFGTDTYGRDVFSRVLAAAQVDFLIAFASIGFSFIVGSILGSLAGYLGSLVDTGIMRVMDIIQSFPPFILGMALAAAIGPGIRNLVIVITVIMVPGFARMIRSRVVSLRERSFIDAAKCTGVPTWKIVLFYLIPNSIGPMVVNAALNMSYAMLDAAGLSFIGLGVRAPQAEWGMMISQGVDNMIAGQWWTSLFPGLALFLSVLGFNILADGLRDLFDPRRKR